MMRNVVLIGVLLAVFSVACGSTGGGDGADPSASAPSTATDEPAPTEEVQRDTVQRFIDDSTMVRVACLDVNADGRVDAADADPNALADVTGDGVVDEADTEVIRQLDIILLDGAPPNCAQGHPDPDWQVSSPVPSDCGGRKGGIALLSIGGGSVELSNPNNAAGVRWMITKIGEQLDAIGIPYQLTSVNPGLVGTENTQQDSEAWVLAYLTTQLPQQPCLWIVLLGHSHGGTAVTATAARLEEAGLGDRILVTVVIDRVTWLYAGDTKSLPQTSPVFNLYQTNEDIYQVRPIDQPNIENWDASGLEAPATGQEGGPIQPVNHSTLDNSPGALDLISERILRDACNVELC